MLVLRDIFITTAPLLTHAVKIDLPKASVCVAAGQLNVA
jgi:biopolymer transport protein ExbD